MPMLKRWQQVTFEITPAADQTFEKEPLFKRAALKRLVQEMTHLGLVQGEVCSFGEPIRNRDESIPGRVGRIKSYEFDLVVFSDKEIPPLLTLRMQKPEKARASSS